MRTGPDWWRGAVVYQIYPRSYQDDNGDGIGDLPGITRRLDHIAALGVDAIWLSPIFTSPMRDMGYDVSDYTDIDPCFGTLADFDALIARAHELGLKVLVDQVLNHSSSDHPWFKESSSSRDNPKSDWYVWVDPQPDGAPPNNWLSVMTGNAWEWEPRRRQYYYHSFLKEQPDLNYHNPAVREEMKKILHFWLDRGVDGFRLDTVNYFVHDEKLRDNPGKPPEAEWPPLNPYDMQLQKYSKSRPENVDWLKVIRGITDQYADRTLVGEVGDLDCAIPLMGEYTAGDDRLHMAYSFDMLSDTFTVAHFREVIEGFWKGAADGWPMWSMSNHDVVRHVSRWAEYDAGDDRLARLAAAMLLSFEGTICLYQGEELGQTDTELTYDELTDPIALKYWPESTGRDGCRTPMVWDESAANAGFSTHAAPWLPVKPPQAARAVANMGAGSILDFYREMIAFRRDTPQIDHGPMQFCDDVEPPLMHLVRGGTEGDGTTRIDCLFNLSLETLTAPVPERARLIGPSQAAEINGGTLTLGPNGFAFVV